MRILFNPYLLLIILVLVLSLPSVVAVIRVLSIRLAAHHARRPVSVLPSALCAAVPLAIQPTSHYTQLNAKHTPIGLTRKAHRYRTFHRREM